MGVLFEVRRRARAAITPVICAGVIGYFGYYAIEGERGVHAYSRLLAEISETRAVLAEVTAERQRLERRAQLLRADGLDLDMLAEQARAVLGLVRPDELVILLPPENAARAGD
jgi:cell division protein FtsB